MRGGTRISKFCYGNISLLDGDEANGITPKKMEAKIAALETRLRH